MKSRKFITLCAFFFLSNHVAYGQKVPNATDGKTVSSGENIKNQKTTQAEKKPLKQSDWSHFFQVFKFKDLGNSQMLFEAGMSIYAASYNTWNYQRLEPFVKLRWALFGKYLSLYTIFSTDLSSIHYELSHFKIRENYISFSADMKSGGKHTFGGGVQFLLLGWKKFNLFGYAQTQSTPISSASLEDAVLTINDFEINIYDLIKDYVNVTYSFERYDCGAILSYQFFQWFSLRATLGYIWLNADIELLLKQELTDVLRTVLSDYDSRMVPDRLSINQSSVFGMIGMNFKLYKRLYLNLEGALLPAEKPIYYGQISFSIE